MIKRFTHIKPYLMMLFLPSFIAVFLLSLSYLFLNHIGEFKTTDQIAKQIMKSDGLYNSALHSMTHSYKTALYNNQKPAVIAFGSSRVLQFQARDFNVPFLNMGGVSGPIESMAMLDNMLKTDHRPDLVILGVDFWWFNKNHPEPVTLPHHNRYVTQITPNLDLLLKPYLWLIEGKFTFSDLIKSLDTNSKNLGVSARTRNDGYDRSGAYHYTSMTRGLHRELTDYQFRSDLSRIKHGIKIFSHGDQIDAERWAQFTMLLRRFQENNIKVILFIPPVAPRILDAMNNTNGYSFIPPLIDRLSQLGVSFFNYHDSSEIGSDDCEFVDGHHGGVNTYRRILVAMAQSHGTLRKLLHMKQLGTEIQKYQGFTSFPVKGEIDFLGLGCPKQEG